MEHGETFAISEKYCDFLEKPTSQVIYILPTDNEKI